MTIPDWFAYTARVKEHEDGWAWYVIYGWPDVPKFCTVVAAGWRPTRAEAAGEANRAKLGFDAAWQDGYGA